MIPWATPFLKYEPVSLVASVIASSPTEPKRAHDGDRSDGTIFIVYEIRHPVLHVQRLFVRLNCESQVLRVEFGIQIEHVHSRCGFGIFGYPTRGIHVELHSDRQVRQSEKQPQKRS